MYWVFYCCHTCQYFGCVLQGCPLVISSDSLFQMDKHGIQLYRIEVSVNNTTLTSYSVYCVVAVLRHWTQLLEIRLYSWKPLFLIVPDRNIIFLANECR